MSFIFDPVAAEEMQQIQAKYSAERDKRLRPEAGAQYSDLSTLSFKPSSYEADP
jgi:hypothetical protein